MAKNRQHTHKKWCVCVDKNMKNGLFRQKLFPPKTFPEKIILEIKVLEKIILENKVLEKIILEIKIFYNLFFYFSVKIFKQNV